jgi:predicted GIY-YIG superfamily endonuclease
MCKPTAKVYIGQSEDPRRRFKQHKCTPSKRMARDVATFEPFEDNCDMEVLSEWY